MGDPIVASVPNNRLHGFMILSKARMLYNVFTQDRAIFNTFQSRLSTFFKSLESFALGITTNILSLITFKKRNKVQHVSIKI